MEAASAHPLATQAAQATLALADLLARTAAVAILPTARASAFGRTGLRCRTSRRALGRTGLSCAFVRASAELFCSPSSVRGPAVDVLVRLVLLVCCECNTSVTTSVTTSVRLVHC